MNDKLKFFDPIPAIKVEQKKYKFYVFKIDAKTLLRIAYTSPRTQYKRTGIQRGLDKKRLKEIGKYITSNGTNMGILPNIIIVSLSEDSYFENNKIFIADKESGEAFIIDGQHRLFAFSEEWSCSTSFDIVVSAFINIDDSFKAYIFRTINEKQRKINPSLVYDLIPMLRDNWVEFEDKRAQYLVEELNTNIDSSWKDGISMLGTRERTITQASFIKAIKSLFKKDRIFTFEEFFEEPIQRNLLILFFNTISAVFKNEWKNKDYILCKNAGVSSMINILDLIIKNLKSKEQQLTDMNGLVLEESNLIEYIRKLEGFDFKASNVGKLYLGDVGMRILTKELANRIF